MSLSVCMATYNGENFIAEQISSILLQLKSDDELIIVDDCSKDNTVQIIRNFNNNKIKIYQNEKNCGEIFTFSRAISLAKNDIIFLSDQDDIWIKGRVELMKKKLLDTGALVIFSNFDIMNMAGKIEPFSHPLKSKDSSRHFNNICGIFLGKRHYYGCTMAFQRKIINLILPIPSFVKSHDLWIAMAGNLLGSIEHIDEKTLIRRIHGNNVTNTNRKLLTKIWSRRKYSLWIISLLYRIIKNAN